ncbi:MAG: HD domain-containing protein [Desulfovibrio sp.]|jgi:putative hydrolase of HD superfamily|nr:HD domain-containing protein [Desulfovibrio sp.]
MSLNIRKSLLQLIFSGAYMKRWNDRLRPAELIEIDKQAHKMIIAWLLCRLSGSGRSQAERIALEEKVVEGGIFDYLFRLVITDIKPPVLDRIRADPEHYRLLAAWAAGEIESRIRPLDNAFFLRFKEHINNPEAGGDAADILGAAHTLASAWELRLLLTVNDSFDEEIKDIGKQFRRRTDAYAHVPGVPGMAAVFNGRAGADAASLARPPYPGAGGSPPCADGRNSGVGGGQPGVAGSGLPARACGPETEYAAAARFAALCGRLRFQKRWSQVPRIPETSVMGHMFITACYAYFLSMSLNACPARRVNNFFTALFHDLPELLTRDIISPVKKSTAGLEQLIRAYEQDELQRRVLGPLAAGGCAPIADRLSYYLGLEAGSEFQECVIRDGKVQAVSFAELQSNGNRDELDPKDGEALKICDILAAFIEAYTAMRNGITSDQIQQSFWRMREQNAGRKLGDIHIGALFMDFD